MSHLPNVTPEVIKAYQDEIARTSSQATVKRKSISLNRFFDWAQGQGHISKNPLAIEKPAEVKENPYTVVTPTKKNNTKTWITLSITTALIILLFLLAWRIKLPIEYIVNYASESSPESSLQTVANNQPTTKPSTSPSSTPSSLTANSAVNGGWNLFAKLKLTDKDGNPSVGAQTLSFKLYKSEDSNEVLYSSPSQSVTTDANGSALISLDQVPAELFFQNNKLFLEPSVGSSSGTLRIPVNTANVSTNLNGYLASNPYIGAEENTVPIINSDGTLMLASESPAIKASQGNFLIEGQTLTLKTADGTDGNIEINPDGKGYVHFLFEGNKGNFVNAQGPNLTSGSLYYGMVPNNSTGYNLINLESGAPKMTSKFRVDALGNTFTAGDVRVGDDLFVTGDISTGGTQRLSSGGALENITGYNQTSGNFTITQGAGDFGSIVKKPASGGALNDLLTLTLDERGKPTTANSDYSTLVLNRYDGWNSAAALKVNTGNAIFNGQVQLGRYSSNPTAIGQGSIVFNTSDGKIYYWDGSSWVNVATGTSSFSGSFTDLTSGTNTTASMVVGTGASLTFSGSGTITASDVTCSGCISNSELANSGITFTGDSGNSLISLGGTQNILGSNGITTSQSGNTLTITAANATTSTVGVASFDPNFFTVSSGNVSVANDSLDFAQFKDSMSLDANTDIATNGLTLSTSGTGALDLASTGQVTIAGNIDATSGIDITGANLTVGGANFSVIPASGNVTTAGDIAINGGDLTSSAGTFNLLNSGVTTLNIGGDSTATSIGAGTGNTTINNNLVVDGTTTFGGITYNWPASQTSTYILQTDGSGTLSWVDPNAAASASNFWNQSLGAVYPKNSSVDLLVGSDATASAKFAVTGVNSGTPTATISGTTANIATFLTGNGNLATTNMSDLTLGGTTTGNVVLNSRGLAALTADGANLSTVGTFTFPNTNTVTGVSNFLRHSQGISVGGAETFYFNATGDISANTGTFTGDVAVNGGDLTTSASTATLFNTNATTVNFAGAANTLNIGPTGAAGTVNISGGSGDTGCTLDGTTGNFTCAGTITSLATSGTQGWWQLTNKILSPANSTYDLAVGGNATGSAFQVFGVEKTNGEIAKLNSTVITSGNVFEATSSAITSGNLVKLGEGGDQNFTGNGIFMDFDNAGGGSFTGNFLRFDNGGSTQFTVDASGNVVAAGDIAVNGGDLTTTQTTANLFNSATTLGIGGGTGTTTVNNSLAVNGNTFSTDETTFNLLNTTATTVNFAGAGTTINIGDVTGTTSVNNSLYVKGATTLGDATTDSITFTGRANSNLLPITNNTYDLGSASLQWANIYGTNIYQNGNQVCDITGNGCPASSAVNYWQLNNKILSPANNTHDLAVGGTATSSAKFQAYGVETETGNIASLKSNTITTGNVLEATASAITSGNILKLGEGGDQNFTGNVILADIGNSGAGGGGFTGNFLKFDNAGVEQFSVASNGDVATLGTISLPNSITLTGVANYLQSSAGYSVGGGTTYYFDGSGNINANAGTFAGDVAVNGADLTTTSTGTASLFNTNATTLNIGGVATTVSLGAATGTTTVNNSLQINGNTTLGNATTDEITFTGRVAQDSDLLPITTTGTNDIGSALLPWDNIYADAFIQNGFNVCDSSGANCPVSATYWQLNNKIVSPSISSYDLAIGGTATGSAFQVFGIENTDGDIAKLNSTVITSGNVFEATSSAITSGNLVKLGTGGDGHSFSGNGIFMDFDNAGGGNFVGNFLRFDNAGATQFTVDSTGNVVASGNVAVNGGSLTTTAGTANLFNSNATTLNIGGDATTISIGNASGTTTINNASTVTTGNLTVQGTTGITESGNGADLTFSGTGTHSISNSNSASALTIDSGNAASLQLNNSSSGDVEIAGGSGATGCTIANATGNLTCSGDVAVNGGDLTTTQTTANIFTNASTLGIGAASGTTTVNNSLSVNGGTIATNQTTFNLINSTATTLNFAGAATTLNIGPSGSAGSVAISGGSGDTGCTLDGTTGNFTCSGNISSTATSGTQGWWQLANKILSPANSTYDLAVGGNATGSAFQVFGIENTDGDIAKLNSTVITTGNVLEATASAITSGNIFKLGQGGDQNFSGNGIYLDFDNTGNGGNGFTGNFVKFDNAGLTRFTVDASGNMVTDGDVAVNGGDLTTTQTTANIFTNASTLGIGAASGTTTINNGLTVAGTTNLNGDIIFGNATTDGITFTGRVAQDSDLLPITTTGTNDIGSPALPWDNIYADAFIQNGNAVCDASGANCPAGAGYWGQSLGSLYPSNNSVDLLIGGDSTTSAKFAFKNILAGVPTATISGTTANVATFLTGEGNLATTNMSDLTLGGSTTGNVVINSRGSNTLTANGADLTAAGTITLPNTNTISGVSGYLQNSNGFAVGGSTTYHFDGSGNIIANDVAVNGNTILGDAVTDSITFTGRANSNLLPITDNTYDLGSALLQWSNIYGANIYQNGNAVCDASGNNCPAGAGYWQLNNKILSPSNSTYDLAIGGTATGSAFQVFGIENTDGDIAKLNSTVITSGNVFEATSSAITSGNLVKLGTGGDGHSFSGNGIFMDFDNAGGGNFVGNFLRFDNAGATQFTVDASGNVVAAGDIAVNGGDLTTTQTTANLFTNATTLGIGAGSGTTTINNDLTVTGNTTLNGDAILGNATTDSITFNGRVAQDSDLLPITTTGTNDIGSALLPWDNIYAVNLFQNGNAVCDASGNNCPAGAGYWAQAAGALYNVNNTVDLLVGSDSTTSAKFAFINVNSGTPTASVSGSIANVSTYLTGNGNLATTNMNNITIGGSTTGNVVLNSRGSDALTANGADLTATGTFTLPNSNTLTGVSGYLQNSNGFAVGGSTTYHFDGSGNIVANDVAVNGGDITSSGALNITPTGALVAGVTTQPITLQGSTAALTSNGAGNDITLTSADQIVLNAGTTVEIVDNTNITGNLDISGTLTSGTSDAFQVDANGNLTTSGTTGMTFTGADSDITFATGAGNHDITASSGTLRLGAFTLLGTVTGNNQNITGIGDLSVNGNTTLGNATTDSITFTARANSSLLPITDNTYDLGSASLQWANVYATAFTQNGFGVCDSSGANCPAGTNYWQLNNKILSPSNSTYDLAIGGTATGSAFQVFGIENTDGDIAKLNSTVITSGNVFEATSSAITSGNLVKLGEGGDQNFTGNGIFMDFDNAGGGSFTGNFLRFDNGGSTQFTVDASGNVLAAGNITSTGDVIVNGGDITSGSALNITPSGTLTAGSTGQAIVLQGSTAALTSNGAGNDITLTSADQIILNAATTVELQDNTNITGNLDVSGTLTSGTADAFQVDANGNLTTSGTTGVTLTGADSDFTFATGAGNHDITASAGTLRLGAFTLLGTVTGNGQDVTGIGDLSVNGNTTLGNATTDEITFTGRVAQDSDLLPITTTGTNDIGSALLPWDNIYADAFIQNGFNVCDSSGANCPAGAGYWALSNQQLYPSNQTYDVVVGGNSTASAKFMAFGIENAAGNIAKLNSTVITTGNVLEATASAITSGNLVKLGTGGDGHSFSGNGIFMDFDNAGGGNFVGNFLRFDNAGSTLFTVDSNGNASLAGTTGLTETGTAAGITFSGSGIHSISASNSGSNLRLDSGNSAVLQLQNLSAGDVEIAGGSSSTGCTITNATGNLTCSGDIAVNGGDLTTSQTTANLFTNATTLGIGGASGTTTINNSLAINGNTLSTDETTFNLLNSTATTINFGGAANTLNIGPTGSSTQNILFSGGSSDTGCTLEGANGNLTCSGNISSTATSGTQGWWQLTNKILSPANSTYDLTVGGNATGAAFQVFGVENATGDIAKLNSTVITSGNVFEATSSAITSGNLVKLGQAGASNFTGNGIFLDFDNTGGGSFTGNFIYATNATASMFVVDASGNVTANGDLAVNGSDITTSGTGAATIFNTNATSLSMGGAATTINLGPTGSSGTVAISGGSGDTGCTLDGTTGDFTCSGDIVSTETSGKQGWWQRNLGVVSPTNITDDLAVGGTATDSASFQVLGFESAASDLVKVTSDTIATGNLISATSSAITSGNLLKLGTGGDGHSFSGNGIFMDFDNAGGGNFTGNFAKFSNDSSVKFLVDSSGSTSIGSGVPLQKLTVQQDAVADIFGLYDGANNINLLVADAGVTTFKPSAFDFVYNFDGVATFTDNSTEAKNNSGTPFTILASENPSNDVFYMGLDHKFATLNVDIATAGVGVTLVKEYWNGSTWTALTVTDNTSNLTVDGTVTFTAPSDWATTSVNSKTKYWVRFCSKSSGGCTGGTGTNITTAPTANFVTPTTSNRLYAYGQSGDTEPAFYINDLGNIGMGTDSPNTLLELNAAIDPTIRISEAGSTTSYSQLTDASATQMLIRKVSNSGTSLIDLDPTTTDGSSASVVRLFRSTNTSGRSSLDLFLGTNSSTVNTSLAGTGDSYIAANNGFVGIGDSTPSVLLNVGTANTTHTLGSGDALISDALEVDGAFYLDGKTVYNTNGTATILLCTGASGATCGTTSALENTLSAGSWIIDNQSNVGEPALAVNNAKGGDLIVASASGTLQFRVTNGGDVFLGNNAGTDLTVGGGTGKIDAGTVDPPYTINGKKYATYLTGIIGVKEEVVGTANTSEYIAGVGYRTVIDFTNLEEGSDLWLFGKTTNMNDNINKLVALLTPSFPTKVWYEVDQENKRLSIYSARPAAISYRLTGPRFDAENWSNRRSEDSETVGFVINNPDTVNNFIENIQVTKLTDFVTEKVVDGAGVASYVLKDASGQVVDGIESIGNFVAANIKAGMLETKDLVAESFIATQGKVDNLLVSVGLVTPDIKTKLISPLANETDITIQIGNEASGSGKLAITNADGTEVASIDTTGTATFSGEIYARNIHSDNLDQIREILEQVQSDQALLAETQSWNTETATASATFNQIAVSDLYVTNQAAMNMLSVTETLTIGTELVLGNGTINTLSAPLKIQELALAPVEIMGGLVNIDTNGNVQIEGNLDVAGTVSTSELAIKNEIGENVSTVDASGSATFNTVSVNQVIIAGAQEATNSAVVNGEINTNATVGKATVPAGVNEITIRNPKVTDYTFVYITPTSSTLNNVLYVKEKSQGYFKVGFTESISLDTNFNWWIVQTE